MLLILGVLEQRRADDAINHPDSQPRRTHAALAAARRTTAGFPRCACGQAPSSSRVATLLRPPPAEQQRGSHAAPSEPRATWTSPNSGYPHSVYPILEYRIRGYLGSESSGLSTI